MLKKHNRLKKRKEFNYIYSNGTSIGSKFLVLLYTHTPKQPVRVGFSVSKKIGNAVFRNKVKRRLSSTLYPLIKEIKDAHTYVFVARKGIENATMQDLENSIKFLLKKANALQVKNGD